MLDLIQTVSFQSFCVKSKGAKNVRIEIEARRRNVSAYKGNKTLVKFEIGSSDNGMEYTMLPKKKRGLCGPCKPSVWEARV